MRGAHITLVTSSIRFAGGRIEVGPWLSLADSSGFAFRCYSSPLHSNLPTNDGHDTRSLAHYLGHRNLQSTARYTAWHRIGSRHVGRIKWKRAEAPWAPAMGWPPLHHQHTCLVPVANR